MADVAALYVYEQGAYSDAPAVELWAADRDARSYLGPHPVVAHPPCARWCALAPLNQAQHGYRVGDDGGCFASALGAVRAWGGVLEHPAYSYAWPAFELPRPTRGMWVRSLLDDGWVTEVSQVAYGHVARKRTWLYYVGAFPPFALDWSEPSSTHQVGGGGWHKRSANLPRLQREKSSSTPAAFRDVLVELARCSRG